MMNWFKYEIRQYTESDISIEDFSKHKELITLLNGTDSKGSFPQDVNFYISKHTGIDIIDIPGGHLGYAQKLKALRMSYVKCGLSTAIIVQCLNYETD